MDELRSILGVLRTVDGLGEPELGPQPSLAGLRTLTDSDDLDVVVSIDGDLDRLPYSVSVTGYRLVQEALTNVRRHAGSPESVEVRVRVGDDELTIEITDDGRGAASVVTDDGFGIIGMRERVGTIGGSVDAGPRRGGGWRVRAVVPLKRTTSEPIASGAPS
jgi:signal transduction histidine kinase